MRKLLLILGALLLSTNLWAIDSCHTGSWYDPDRAGEGITIEVIGDVTVVYFYTFDRWDDQVWYTMIGDRRLVMYSSLIIPDDDEFFTKQVIVGDADIEILTDDVIFFNYDRALEYFNGDLYSCVGDICKGSYVYRRITQPIPCD